MPYEEGYQAREIRVRVKWLMILRVTVVTVLLGSLTVLQIYQKREPIPAVYLLITATYFLTIFYSILFYKVRNFFVFAYIQIIGDVLFETGMVYATGGLDSGFSFIYFFSVIAAGFILSMRVSLIVASLAGISYGALVDLQYYGVLLQTPARVFSLSEILYNIFLNFFAFYFVSVLASSLSERQRATREALAEKSIDLRELRALNENIVRSMADGMVTVGLDGRITAFNKAAEYITGRSFKEVRGKHFSEVFNWLGIDAFFDEINISDKPPRRYEISYPRGDKDLALGVAASPLRNEHGEITGLLVIFQDLTPMKEMEEEIKKKDRLAAIGELSAGMAHEIRNPLASLSGALQVLREETRLTDEDRNLMDIALSEMDRLNDILTEFLIYARPRKPAKEGCDITGIIKDTVELVAGGRDIGSGVEIVTDMPEQPLRIEADPAQMRQVFLNLTLNAVQSLSGSGRVVIRAAEGSGNTVMVEVEDDGEGIDKDDIDKVFYPFFSTKEGGAGLGLAIVYRIIEEHGGNIKVESEPGKGTMFSMLLPMEGAD